ncbi:F-box protein At5g07610-like [Papaver somniferum]|uniref:F-box protein At5g07610-like n=1 Tax=Papaver somniferum TaxID=3469 RepID=UPI000E6FD7E9|nr:F-box protein At5g07610-like [Papaver somniferum]
MENSSSIKRINRKHLTDDIWYEIFLRLTLDSIFKFRCVSKLWFSILSNPSFLNKWYKLNIASLPWGFVHEVPLPEDSYNRKLRCEFPDLHSRYVSHHGFSFRFLHEVVDNNMCILSSSNGLVLCSLVRQESYYACNPLTQKCVLLPPPPRNNIYQFLAASMYNDPTHTRVVTGFMCNSECFLEPTSYKGVRIPKFEAPTKEFKVEMFSSDVGEWNVYHVSRPLTATWKLGNSDNFVTYNGVFYWFQKRNYKILAVSVNRNNTNHECRLINMPELEMNGDEINWLSESLGESEGLICLARFKKLEERLSVWVLDGNHWYMLHDDIILHDQLAELESQLIDGSGWKDFINDIEVVGFSPVDKNVVILSCRKYVWAYNTKTRVFEQLCHHSFPRSLRHFDHHVRALAFYF